MVTIRVGIEPNHKDFVAHESFLTARSVIFQHAMNGRWEESKSRVIPLPEDKPETFQLYLHHVYTGKVPVEQLSDHKLGERSWAEFKLASRELYVTLLPVYVLAEKLQDVSAKNAVVEAIFNMAMQKSSEGSMAPPPEDCLHLINDATPQDSAMRQLVVDLWADADIVEIKECIPGMPRDVLQDLLISIKTHQMEEGCVTEIKGLSAYLEPTMDEDNST
jgi:hypothetical protein